MPYEFRYYGSFVKCSLPETSLLTARDMEFLVQIKAGPNQCCSRWGWFRALPLSMLLQADPNLLHFARRSEHSCIASLMHCCRHVSQLPPATETRSLQDAYSLDFCSLIAGYSIAISF